MDILAKAIINHHKNPIVKVDLPGTKLFLRTYSNEESELIEKSQNTLQNVLQHTRVERRCARAKAVWIPEQSLAKVTKVVKSLLKFYGFQNKNGIFLYPEEMLYLLETNRLEVTLNNIPLTIQEAYEFVTNKNSLHMNLNKYRVYKKLAAMGYKLLRHEHYIKKMVKKAVDSKKVKSSEQEENADSSLRPAKKLKIDYAKPNVAPSKFEEHSCNFGKSTKERACIDGIFSKIRKMAPKEYISKSKSAKAPDYCAFLPAHLNKSVPDFNVFICEDSLMDNTEFGKSSMDIYAVYGKDDVSFYKVCEGHLPQI